MQTGINNFPYPFINPLRIFISNKNIEQKNFKNTQPAENKHSVQSAFKIIMVDDDIDDREMFAEAAEELNMNLEVTCIETGRELIQRIDTGELKTPDVIVLDLNMPDKNGRECIEYIRSSSQNKNTPIIIYSTSSSGRDIEDTYNKGANLYIRKPSSYNDLKEIIKAITKINWNELKPFGSQQDYMFKLNK